MLTWQNWHPSQISFKLKASDILAKIWISKSYFININEHLPGANELKNFISCRENQQLLTLHDTAQFKDCVVVRHGVTISTQSTNLCLRVIQAVGSSLGNRIKCEVNLIEATIITNLHAWPQRMSPGFEWVFADFTLQCWFWKIQLFDYWSLSVTSPCYLPCNVLFTSKLNWFICHSSNINIVLIICLRELCHYWFR